MTEIICPLTNSICDKRYCNKIGKATCINHADSLAEFALGLSATETADKVQKVLIATARIFRDNLGLNEKEYELFLDRIEQTIKIGRIDISDANQKDGL